MDAGLVQGQNVPEWGKELGGASLQTAIGTELGLCPLNLPSSFFLKS